MTKRSDDVRPFAVNQRGTTVLLVEQNVNMALKLAKRAYVLSTGRIVLTDSAENLLRNQNLLKAYLGG